jgi:hypothetical protein
MGVRFDWDKKRLRQIFKCTELVLKRRVQFLMIRWRAFSTMRLTRLMTMKKTPKAKSTSSSDEMLPEYRFDYSRAKPNRFAGRIEKKRVIVSLDPDVAKVFSDSESVNNVLRALITTMPTGSKRQAKKAA